MAALIADTYLTEVSQALGNQARDWLDDRFRQELEKVTYEDLVSQEALVTKIHGSIPQSEVYN